ncbi:hypothetical protein BU17DRAFT_43485 [Hysterangium stoloniferum]|nr:hypothetical protein BU17DRAFT_43485 [Hysterangium stoloniferum]
MSFLPGLVSGSLVAGGVGYTYRPTFLSLMRLSRYIMQSLAERLQEPRVPAPPSAAERIQHNPRRTFIMQRWNEEVEGLFHTVRNWDKKVVEWGRRIIGEDGA